MPGTEIDDIFSGKASTMIEPKAVSSGGGGKGKPLKSGATKTTTMRGGEGKKRQTNKKENQRGVVASFKKDEKEVGGTSRNETETENQEAEKPATSPTKKPKKRRREEVEEVVDPSITVKKPRLEKDGKSQKVKDDLAKTNKGGGTKTDIDKFKDSRGSGGRRLLTYGRSEDGLINFPFRKTDGGRVSDIHGRRVGHE